MLRDLRRSWLRRGTSSSIVVAIAAGSLS